MAKQHLCSTEGCGAVSRYHCLTCGESAIDCRCGCETRPCACPNALEARWVLDTEIAQGIQSGIDALTAKTEEVRASWKLSSYPKVYNLGHAGIRNLFDSPVLVQEKVDGSQFSFGVRDGELHLRSKGAVLYADAPNKMFAPAIATVVDRYDQGLLNEGWTYRAEAFMKPKHNVLAYERAPVGGLILYDVDRGDQDYLTQDEIGPALGLEVVPALYIGMVDSWDFLKDLLERESVLGGTKIEGVVCKNYAQFGRDGKVLMGKYVSEAFKEIAGGEWRKMNPTRKDVIAEITSRLRTEARWQKAVQHLDELGVLENDPRDIGKLIGEIQRDTHEEMADEIKDILFKHFWKGIGRGVIAGFPEWYKERLAESTFST